jgi:hypothetical protein
MLDYNGTIQDSGNANYVNRVLIATPVTGLVRIEWVMARYGQIIPCNWGMVQMTQYMNTYYPLRYQVADAQNLIAKTLVEGNYEWLFLLEHDVVIPPDCFVRLNDYMRDAKVPVVSGLYYTRSRPSEPVIYRGRGRGYYPDWKMGDRVWVDGVPTGCLLVHGGIIRAMWDDSPEYQLNGITTRRVFDTPMALWVDPETGSFNTTSGTSDLDWCTRVMAGTYFAKAGYDSYQQMRWPFLVDTQIFSRHVNPNGEQFP